MSVKEVLKASIPQVKKINVLINKLELRRHKESLVMGYTNNRTTSIAEMSMEEAKLLIHYLVKLDPDDIKRRRIISLGYKTGLLYGETPEDKKINIAKLNMFLKSRGAVKKELNHLNTAELIKVQRQFEAMLKNTNDSIANKTIKSLLKELNIPLESV